MTMLQWATELALIGLLGAAIPFALRLERQLAAIRRDRPAFEGGAAEYQEATRQAEATLVRLRAAAEDAGRQVSERIAAAGPLRDDLRFLAERAEVLADRLDGAVRAAQPPRQAPQTQGQVQPAVPAREAGAGRSQAEHDLLQALRMVR